MELPVVCIVGRPNVGKSSLLNAIYRSPVAIVDDTPGTTRDRVEVVVKHRGKAFRLIDTGGMGLVDRDDLEAEVESQIGAAIAEATLVLFVVDVREGILPLDGTVAEALRHVGRPVIVVVNKCDTGKYEDLAGRFHALGFGEPTPVSATEGYGRAELLDRIVEDLPDATVEADSRPPIKLAVVGRRNVGKSTLINQLVGSKRLITSSIPGTTRDAVDVPFIAGGRRFIGIDTAGMRKKQRVHENVEFFSHVRTERAIRRADVVLLLLDASRDVGRVDKKLADFIVKQYRPVILVVNKWDLAQARGIEPEVYQSYLTKTLPGLDFAPIAFMSALEGFNTRETLEVAERLHEQARSRAATGELNRVIQDAVARRSPPRRGNRAANVFYATQIEVDPPTVVIFVSDATLFDRPYIHYLENALRASLPYDEVPVKVELRSRKRSPSKAAQGPPGEYIPHVRTRKAPKGVKKKPNVPRRESGPRKPGRPGGRRKRGR